MTVGDTRVGARTFSLEQLVHETTVGRIRVPHFQRGFHWTRDHVVQLMDSVIRGYPIGSPLLWERPAPAARLTIGSVTVDAPAVDSALWVIDGQQRIVSLVNVLGIDRNPDERFALGYDLRTSVVTPLAPTEDPLVVPFPVLFDLSRVLTWFIEHPEADEHQDSAFDVADQLRNVAVVAYLVSQDDFRVVLDIFDRTNNAGRRLSRAEVFSALTADEREDEPTLEKIAERVESTGFGRIDDETLLHCFLARRGPDVHRDIRSEFDPAQSGAQIDFRDESRRDAFDLGEEAIVRAVDFVRNAGVPHLTFLPYRYLLVVTTRFLSLHPTPSPYELRLFQRWFWRAAWSGPAMAGGSSTGLTRRLCGRITRSGAWKSVSGLLDVVGEGTHPLPDLRVFRVGTAGTKVVLCSWWDLRPRHLVTGLEFTRSDLSVAIDAEATAAGAVRTILPHRLLTEKHASAAANRLLMPITADDDAVPDLVQHEATPGAVVSHEKVLASHMIIPDAELALNSGDADRFLTLRYEELESQLAAFLRKKCEWGFENTPPLAELELDDLVGGDDGGS